MEIVTARLSLRPPDIRNAADVMVQANDRRVTEMLGRMPFPYTYADALAWIALARASQGARQQCMFGIFAGPARDDFVGACGINPLGKTREPHLGYWIGAQHWGRGYAQEAAAAVLRRGFETMRFPTVHSGARVINPYSRSVLTRLGFRHLGVKEFHSLRGPGECVDVFRLTAAEWRAAEGER